LALVPFYPWSDAEGIKRAEQVSIGREASPKVGGLGIMRALVNSTTQRAVDTHALFMHITCSCKEVRMASLQIRDMPEDLYESLKLKAEKDHRSLAQQAIILLSEALKPGGRDSSRRMNALQKIRSNIVETKSKDISIVELIQEDRGR
jgi:antitoxin FitA